MTEHDARAPSLFVIQKPILLMSSVLETGMKEIWLKSSQGVSLMEKVR